MRAPKFFTFTGEFQGTVPLFGKRRQAAIAGVKARKRTLATGQGLCRGIKGRAHGVWRYLGKGRFGVTMWDIFYAINTGQLLHYRKIRVELTLDDDRDEASARATLEVLDPQGVVLSSRNGALSLARIPFEPLQ